VSNESSPITDSKKKLYELNPKTPPASIQTQRTRRKQRAEPVDPKSLERNVRQLLADKISGNQLGLWLLVPEHLRLGTWDLLCGWTGSATPKVEPRLALQLVHEAALCVTGVRQGRSLSQKGFELVNGLPFVATDQAVHDLLAAHTMDQAQRLQIALGQLRRASGHFPGRLLAIDPHRLNSCSKRQMVRFRDDPRLKAVKVAQTFFCLDAQTSQPVCFTSASSARTVAQATPELLQLAKIILNPTGEPPLLMADCEHFNRDLIEQVQLETPFDLLVPLPNHKERHQQYAQLPASQFTPRWAGFATAKRPFVWSQNSAQKSKRPLYEIIQRSGEKAEDFYFKSFLATADRPEVTDLSVHYPKRWHVEEFFKFNQALGWQRAGTLNLNIRYGHMTLALLAQAVIHQFRQNLGSPFDTWDAPHLAKDVFCALEGDVRVNDDTIVVTYYNAPNAEQLRQHYQDLPAKLKAQKLNPKIPWLYNFKLDFRFK
jgi:hypothetical protein